MEPIDTHVHDGNGAALGFLLTTTSLIVAETSKSLNSHIPPLIMDSFQLAAWVTAMLTGLFTIYYKFLKPKKK